MHIEQVDHHLWLANGSVMGGPWQFRFYAGRHQQEIAQAVYEALYQVEQQMSHFLPTSDLMRLNQAPTAQWVPVPTALATVMATAWQLAQDSHNAIDITLGKAVNQWGFGPTQAPQNIPSTPACGHGYQSYQVRFDPPSVYKHDPIHFNLCAIAKGFAVDQAAQAARHMGIEHFIVEAAGEIIASGCMLDGSPWMIGLELPVPGQCIVYDQLPLINRAIATSGSYRKFHTIQDHVITHTINPTTGSPLETDILSLTVLHEQCMYADAIATILYVMGAEKGSEWAHEHGIAAQFMLKMPDGVAELRTQAWIDYCEACLHKADKRGSQQP